MAEPAMQLWRRSRTSWALALSRNDIDVHSPVQFPKVRTSSGAEHKFGDRHAVITSVSHPLQRRRTVHFDLAVWRGMPPDEGSRAASSTPVKRLGAARRTSRSRPGLRASSKQSSPARLFLGASRAAIRCGASLGLIHPLPSGR